MRIAKIGVIALFLFLFMALGGIGGVMLAGYTFILRAG
ncbi:TPA: protein YohO [Escherichia coli]|nr:protein YohO [Escherichia coli]MDM1654517.1 protein YohO [Escherichia coli]HAY8836714.1 protein YohO [Shigella boydii]HEM0465705.1 protein YohO [Escherichia coli]